jgi:hypothetical protein
MWDTKGRSESVLTPAPACSRFLLPGAWCLDALMPPDELSLLRC